MVLDLAAWPVRSMPIGNCPNCKRLFVMADDRSSERICPGCLRPLRPVAMAEALARLRGEDRASWWRPGESMETWLDDEPLAASERGQRLLTALAEAAYQSDCARLLVQKARSLRGQAEPAEAGEDPSPPPGRERGSQPHRGQGDGREYSPRLVVTDSERRWEASFLIARAEAACRQARAFRDEARAGRERRHGCRRREWDLPPLEFRLPRLDSALDRFALDAEVGDGRLEESEPWPDEGMPGRAITTLYVWGYGPPQSDFCRERCEPTEAAAYFAAEAGWETDRPGAWAREITVPCGLSEALQRLQPLFRQDAAVGGWGGRQWRCR